MPTKSTPKGNEKGKEPLKPFELEKKRLDDVTGAIDQICRTCETVGASVGVAARTESRKQPIEILLQYSRGDAYHGERPWPDQPPGFRQHSISHDTQFPIVGLTYCFTAATVAALVKDGVLKWEMPIFHHFPPLEQPALRGILKENKVTLLQVVAHLTGLQTLDCLWWGAENEVLAEKTAVLDVCQALRPAYRSPSTGPHRNAWLYSLLGIIIERRTGKQWHEVVKTKILEPLAMSSTSHRPRKNVMGPGQVGHADPHVCSQITDIQFVAGRARSPQISLPPLDTIGTSAMAPSHGLHSTVPDLLRFGCALLPGKGGANPPLKPYLPFPLDALHSERGFVDGHRRNPDSTFSMAGFIKTWTPAILGHGAMHHERFDPTLEGMLWLASPEVGNGLFAAGGQFAKVQRGTEVWYQSTCFGGYNHSMMLLPALQMVIVVLTNSESLGDAAD